MKYFQSFLLSSVGVGLSLFLFAIIPSEALAGTVLFSGNNICQYIGSIYTFGTSAVGILSVLMIMIGGGFYLYSAGNEERVNIGKNMIYGAIVGLILVFVTILFYNTLAPNILQCRNTAVSANTQTSPTNQANSQENEDLFKETGAGKNDFCAGKTTYASQDSCSSGMNSSGGGSGEACLKNSSGKWCRTTCGDPDTVLREAKKLEGACFAPAHCAFVATRGLVNSGCKDFPTSSSTVGNGTRPVAGQQLVDWGFKERRVSSADDIISKGKPGDIIYYKGHAAVYLGNGKIMDSIESTSCGLNSSKARDFRQSRGSGETLACENKNPYERHRPTASNAYTIYAKNSNLWLNQCVVIRDAKSSGKTPIAMYGRS